MKTKFEEFTKVTRYQSNLEERCVVEVFDTKGKIVSIGVCPGCFNTKSRRKTIINSLKIKGYSLVSKNDDIKGIYLTDSKHVSLCQYK